MNGKLERILVKNAFSYYNPIARPRRHFFIETEKTHGETSKDLTLFEQDFLARNSTKSKQNPFCHAE